MHYPKVVWENRGLIPQKCHRLSPEAVGLLEGDFLILIASF